MIVKCKDVQSEHILTIAGDCAAIPDYTQSITMCSTLSIFRLKFHDKYYQNFIVFFFFS